MDSNIFQRPERFTKAFQASKRLRACSFDAEPYLEDIPGDATRGVSPTCFLPVSAKRTWFFTYCEEAQKVGQIIPNVDIRFDIDSGSGRRIGYAIGTCDVVIDGIICGSAQAGQSFNLDNSYELDNVIQGVTGLAQSKALTNAGFGTVSGTDLEVPSAPIPAGGIAPSNATPPPVSPSNNTTPSAAAGAAQQSGNAIVQEQASGDPKQQAKAVLWPFSGSYAGKTLGELLATKPDKIEYLAMKWNGNSPAKDAAKLLLPDALTAMGKPVPANG